MDWDLLLSFCSLYLCTVLVYLLKQRFFTTEPSCIDRVDVLMRATVLAMFPNEYMKQDIITVVVNIYYDITGIITPIVTVISERTEVIWNILITISNFAIPEIIYWIIIILVTLIVISSKPLLTNIDIEGLLFICRLGASSLPKRPPQTPLIGKRIKRFWRGGKFDEFGKVVKFYEILHISTRNRSERRILWRAHNVRWNWRN